MSVKEILEALRQMLVISETQKRQEEDIKELKQFMLKFSLELQRLADQVQMNDQRSRSDHENLSKQMKLELENLALKMQLAAQAKSLKPMDESSSDKPSPRATKKKKS